MTSIDLQWNLSRYKPSAFCRAGSCCQPLLVSPPHDTWRGSLSRESALLDRALPNPPHLILSLPARWAFPSLILPGWFIIIVMNKYYYNHNQSSVDRAVKSRMPSNVYDMQFLDKGFLTKTVFFRTMHGKKIFSQENRTLEWYCCISKIRKLAACNTWSMKTSASDVMWANARFMKREAKNTAAKTHNPMMFILYLKKGQWITFKYDTIYLIS